MAELDHYIVVHVRERNPDSFTTDMARVRKAIHKEAEKHDLKVADVVIRGDRARTYYGFANPWPEISAIFNKLMFQAKTAPRVPAIRPRRTWLDDEL